MLYCPKCRAEINANASSCQKCNTLLSEDLQRSSVEKSELNEVQKRKKYVVGVILKIGYASVAIPAIGFIVGIVLILIIPSCVCDEGAGCRGCGINNFVGFCFLGGFVGALGALVTVLPICALLALLLNVFGRNK